MQQYSRKHFLNSSDRITSFVGLPSKSLRSLLCPVIYQQQEYPFLLLEKNPNLKHAHRQAQPCSFLALCPLYQLCGCEWQHYDGK